MTKEIAERQTPASQVPGYDVGLATDYPEDFVFFFQFIHACSGIAPKIRQRLLPSQLISFIVHCFFLSFGALYSERLNTSLNEPKMGLYKQKVKHLCVINVFIDKGNMYKRTRPLALPGF
jgi:hypothetical protein